MPAREPSLALRVVSGVNRGSVCALGRAPIAIGGAASSDLCLGDRHVSRSHCEVFERAGEYWVRDLGSTNGTYVDGHRVSEAPLTRTTRLVIGMSQLSLEPLADGMAEEQCGEMVGSSPSMRQVFSALRSVAQSSLTCLLLGETGTGKELAARA
ncbi:MAG TPA: FHA domain-containing protein, partial [Polyangiales bacterium]|nr:FHA domain-containing protein [Polyangiales bacterium]